MFGLYGRAGPAGALAHPPGLGGGSRATAPLVGLFCGAAGLVIAVSALTPIWLSVWRAGVAASSALCHLHGWVSVPLIVFGFAFGYTAPDRRLSALERAQYERWRSQPRLGFAGFALGAGSWLPLPLAAWLHYTMPMAVNVTLLLLWPLALLVEMSVFWWWRQRNETLVEIGGTGRARLIPAYLLHPLVQGWLWGTVFILLLFAMAGQIHAFP